MSNISDYLGDSNATPNTVVKRDANGRTQFSDPSANQDAATKSYVDSHAAPATQYLTTDTTLTSESPPLNVIGCTSLWKDVKITLPDASAWYGQYPITISRDGTDGKRLVDTARLSLPVTGLGAYLSQDKSTLYIQDTGPTNFKIGKYSTSTWSRSAQTGVITTAVAQTTQIIGNADDSKILCLDSGSRNLTIVNTSTMSIDSQTALGTSGTGRCLATDGSYAYCTTSAGLYRVNLVNLTVTTIATASTLFGVAYYSGYLYVQDNSAGLRTFSTTSLINTSTISLTNNSESISEIYSGHVLVDNIHERLWVQGAYLTVLDISVASSPTKIAGSLCGVTGNMTSNTVDPNLLIDLTNSLLWAADGSNLIRAYDLNSSLTDKAPTIAFEYLSGNLSNQPLGLLSDGSLLYVAPTNVATANPTFVPIGCQVTISTQSGQVIDKNAALHTLYDPEDSVTFIAVNEDGNYGWVIADKRTKRLGGDSFRVKQLSKTCGLQDFPNDAYVVQLMDGSLWGWGDCTAPGLLNGATAGSSALSPILWGMAGEPLYANTIIDWIFTGGNTYAVLSNGELWGGGANTSGQLCDGTTTAYDYMRYIYGGQNTGVNFVKVWGYSANNSVANGGWYATTSDHKLYGAGYNNDGQIGIGSSTNVNTPTLIKTFSTGITDIQIGQAYAHRFLLVLGDSGIWGCGYNGTGNLADNTTTAATTLKNLIPNLNTGQSVSKIFACGGFDTVSYHCNSWYITTDGLLWAAGDNATNQLGDGTTTDSHAWKQVPQPDTADSSIHYYVDLILGVGTRPQIYAVLNSGHVAIWGYGAEKALFSTGTSNVTQPALCNFANTGMPRLVAQPVMGSDNANLGCGLILGYSNLWLLSGNTNNVTTVQTGYLSGATNGIAALPQIPQMPLGAISSIMFHGSAGTQRVLALMKNGDLWINGDNSNGFAQSGLSYSTTLTKIGWTKLRTV